jgi:hypothetical protein
MGQAIEQRGRELFVTGEDGDPFRKREIRSHHRGPALVPIGDQIEKQLATGALEGDEAQLVDDEHLHAEESLLQPRELTSIPRLEQLAHEVGSAGKQHTPFLLRGLDAERDCEVRLARASRANYMMPMIFNARR